MSKKKIPTLGWKKDKYDKRDYLHKPKVARIPVSDTSLKKYLPDVRDQLNSSSCTGFGIGGNLTGKAKKLGVYSEWFSPLWIYNGARFIEGTLDLDVGAYPRDCFEWLLDNGCLLESYWPYLGFDKTSPPSHLVPEAQKHPLAEYFRVVDGVDGICSAIADGNFVSIGTPWYDTWLNVQNGILPEVTLSSRCIGGHETFLYGYDMASGVVYGQNSWGTLWGDYGKFTMPMTAFDVFKSLGGYDAHYVRVDWEQDEPEPESSKKYLQLRHSIDGGNVWKNWFTIRVFF